MTPHSSWFLILQRYL